VSKICEIERAQIVQSETKKAVCLRLRHSQQMQVTSLQGITIGSELSALPRGDKIYSGRPCWSHGDAYHCLISTTQYPSCWR